MFNKTQLIEALKSEGSIPIDDWILDRLISSGTEMTVPAKGYIIADGEIDKSLYITASGVTKAYFFDGKKESVLGFSGEGTMTLSPLCMILGRHSADSRPSPTARLSKSRKKTSTALCMSHMPLHCSCFAWLSLS